MKKLFILLVTLFTVIGATAQWIPQNSGTTNNLNSVYFTDVNMGCAVGDSGIILKTTDGGTSWTSLPSGTNNNLWSVYFTDANTSYAVGDNGTILKNGTSQNSGTVQTLSSIFFTDANTGYAVGASGTILKTSNGGSNWTSQTSGTSNNLGSVCFSDVNIGYAVGDSGIILKTVDGGAIWTLQITDSLYNLSSVFFTSTNTGYAVGNHWDWLTGGNSIMLKTINGGINWSASFLSQIDGLSLMSIFFKDDNRGYAVGKCCFEGSKIIYNTTDGGINWTFENYSLGRLNSVYFPSADTGYSVGLDGIILKTTNGGVGVNDQHQHTNPLITYPNPTIDKFTIETQSTGFFSILNLCGQQLLQQRITEPKTTIDINAFSNGVYIIKLINENRVHVGKIVKK